MAIQNVLIWSDCANEHDDLNLCWVHMYKSTPSDIVIQIIFVEL